MNKKVLLLSNAYYPSIGGVENSLRHLAKEAIKCGDKPQIIVSDICVSSMDTNRYHDSIDGIDVHRYAIKPYSGIFKIFNVFASNYRHYKLLKSIRLSLGSPVLVIARFHYSACLAYLAGYTNIKYVVPSIYKNQLKAEPSAHFISKLINGIRLVVHNKIQRKALSISCNYVFSETMKRQCTELTGDNNASYVITKPGVDMDRFYPVTGEQKKQIRQSLNLPEDKPIILFVGRFVAAKGVSILLDAFSLLESDAILVLVGEGSEYQAYLDKIKMLRITDRVKVFPPTRDVEKFYQSADIFAMTSSYEPLGQTILEAMSSGLKVVAFRPSDKVDTAIDELADPLSVSFVEEYSASALSDILSRDIININKESAFVISRRAQNKYSWSALYSILTE
ncbi:TPA: glycosyltransferase family 4 protein [Aeromonas veronii]